jgi:hypothetical protein
MAINVIETYGIRRTYGDNPSIEVPYICEGSNNETAIKDAIYAEADEERDGLILSDVSVENIGGGKWQATATYTLKGETVDNENADTVQWDLSPMTVNVKVSKQSIGNYAPSGQTAPDMRQSIGYDGERVNGVDVNVGQFTFTVNRKYTDDECDEDFMTLLSHSAFHYNADAFWIWEPGEVLFMGASGGRDGGAIVESGDDNNQLSGYDGINGITIDNSDNGTLYFEMEEVAGFINIRAYMDSGHSIMVASGALGSVGDDLTLVEYGASGISGDVHIDAYVEDADNIVVQFPFPWSVTYKFAVEQNATTANQKIPVKLGADSAITYVEKKGWDYVWYIFEKKETGTGADKTLIERPKYAYVDRVYDSVNFADLKLGASPWKTSPGSSS